MLQQYLPLAVLKLMVICTLTIILRLLQQYLPLAVLKQPDFLFIRSAYQFVATVPTACGIETFGLQHYSPYRRCNSTYRLRY